MSTRIALTALFLTVLANPKATMAVTEALPDPTGEEQLKVTQEHLLKMHELSNRILASKDPKQKEHLKAEQRELMRSFDRAHQHLLKQHLETLKKSQENSK